MTRTELKLKIIRATDNNIRLFNKYGKQIKVCNSANSTDEDFTLLTKIKEDWHNASLEATKYETLLTSFYTKKDGKNNTQEKESIAL
jgi:hypothetical protein